MESSNGARKVAIVAGLRTPFAKQSTAYRDLSALDLGKLVVAELLQRISIDPSEIQQFVYGQVVPSLSAPNIAREIVLGTGMPRDIEAYSVSRACATSYQSAVNVAEAIMAGAIDCGVAGGADSASDVPIAVSKKLAEALIEASRARTRRAAARRLQGALARATLVPVPPALKEPSTGLTMGESAEKMAKENGITRAAQDEFAHRSHSLAAKAWEDGRFEEEVMHVFVPPQYEAFDEDNLVRRDSSLESYSKLKPAFDRKHGTITAGNSSAADRRRQRAHPDERGQGEGRGPGSARLHQELRVRGAGPGRADADGAVVRDADGARPRRHQALGPRPDRHARGLRGAGPEQHPGLRER